MTQEDRQLLLRDLCARLPYGVICNIWFKDSEGWKNENMKLSGLFNDDSQSFFTSINGSAYSDEFKPYLRSLSSMTDEERIKIASMAGHFNSLTKSIEVCFACLPVVDYCYSRHLDIHGLIEKGLALEAPEGMYKTE